MPITSTKKEYDALDTLFLNNVPFDEIWNAYDTLQQFLDKTGEVPKKDVGALLTKK